MRNYTTLLNLYVPKIAMLNVWVQQTAVQDSATPKILENTFVDTEVNNKTKLEMRSKA